MTSTVLLQTPALRIAEQIALDRALMPAVGAGALPPLARVWEFPDEAVVVGVAQRPDEYVHREACAADGVPVLRRFSGGGTVCIMRGCVVFSVIMPLGGALKVYDVSGAYRHILLSAINRFCRLNIPVVFEPPCDLVVNNRKIAGNAQAQKRGAVLVHGSVLVNADIARMERYLRQPAVAPAYRAGRSHAAFVQNLSAYGLTEPQVAQVLAEAWAPEGLTLEVEDAFVREAAAHCHLWAARV